ncbi:LysM peptidoglycan-binding domain-containing protein [Paenibacillus alvei]|uniref:LysM peptidoglycan-binding domain-containing protein n=1 Tax=Paenibacillus alvei TaxID=44250 RepID=UPI00227E8B19|nr:LysM peptidoglycan-binding domain-containing protein [Paenibacillus alvei]MCY7486047.1 LysM peptidoglycan-binding domain-containing protein [Paenibacillus alvei]
MEFWLTRKNGAEKLWFPIPATEFSVDGTRQITKEYINGAGEIALAGRKQLSTISFSSWLPAQPKHRYAQYPNYKKPYEIVALLEKWKNDMVPVRFFITKTGINFGCLIEAFRYYERAGSRDVEFELSLVEYRYLTPSKITVNPKIANTKAKQAAKRIPDKLQKKTKFKTYVFKKGETIYSIARKVYGDPKKFVAICKLNKITNPDKIKVGTVLKLP